MQSFQHWKAIKMGSFTSEQFIEMGEQCQPVKHSAIIGFKQGTRADFKVKRVII